MKLSAYVTKSRHGIFYFRWPVPLVENRTQRATVRLSLRTRCPKGAGRIARYLASSSESLWRAGVPTQMRHDELRAHILAFFKTRLAEQVEKINVEGQLPEVEREAIRATQALAGASVAEYWGVTNPEGTEAFLGRFCEASGLPSTEAEARPDRMLKEIQKAHRDMLNALEKHMMAQEQYDFSAAPPTTGTDALSDIKSAHRITLSHAIDEYLGENRHAKAWESGTFDKKEAALAVLTEELGFNRCMSTISKQEAQGIKRLLLVLPSNRNKHPQTRGLSLQQASSVQGVPKMTTVTVNSYLSTFQSFYEWAEKNGHVEANLFEGLRVATGRKKAGDLRSC